MTINIHEEIGRYSFVY